MAAVVGAVVAFKANVVISADDGGNIQRAVAAHVRGFDEIPVGEALDVADVRKRNAVVEIMNHLHQVVIRVRAKRAAAQRQAVAGAIDHLQNRLEVGVVFDDARQAENGKRRIVRVNGHLDARLLGGGDDGFEEIFEIAA